MTHPLSQDSGGQGGGTDRQGQVDDIVSQLTSSREAMQRLGDALSGPLISSLQAAGALPSSSQPRGLGGFPACRAYPQPPTQAGPAQFFPHPGFSQYDGYSAYPQFIPPMRNTHSHDYRRSALLSDSDTLSQSEEGSLDPDDQLRVHPDWDEDIDLPLRGTVSEDIASFLKETVSKPATNAQRKEWIEKHSLPKVPELAPPKMDMTMRLLVSKDISSHDQWLKKMQTTTYEAAGPLIHLLSSLEGEEEMDTDRVKEALKLSLSLMGNAFARFSQERRRKILVGINSQLGHMADEDFDSSDVLFGEGAVDRIKKRTEAIKTLQRVKQPFRQGGAQGRGQPVHRGKQGHFRHSVSKGRVLPYPNKTERGGRGARKGQ